MMNFDEETLRELVAQRIADDFADDDYIRGLVETAIAAKVDRIFAEAAETQIAETLGRVISDGFEREYQKVTSFGSTKGEKTSIRKELEKIVGSYWSDNVDAKTGKKSDSSYNAITRAEYLMTTICAKDFSDQMRNAAISITGALKDGLRGQMAKQVDDLLNSLFHVKSLQDQGKVEKPY